MRPNFFTELPPDILQHMFSWLNLHGPKVKLIVGDPTEEERRTVIATAVAHNDLSKPDLSTYHLIKDYNDDGEIVYKIGFCKGRVSDDAEATATAAADDSLTYKVVTLDPKSPLRRYVTEDLQHPEYSKLFPYDSEKGCNTSTSQDRLLLKYIELEIKAASGLTSHPLRNRTQLAAVCQDSNTWMNGYATRTQTQLFERSIKEALLDDLLHHIAYDERDEAKAILRLDPSLLLSPFAGRVTDCSPERTFPETTAFQLAVWSGHWHMWEMMLDVVNTVSEDEQVAYRDDLLEQFRIVEEKGLEYTLDNLLNKGLRILDAQALQDNPFEQKRLVSDVVDRNAYHLIIRKDKDGVVQSCVLGYRHRLDHTAADTEEYEYTQHSLTSEHPLFKIADGLHQSLQDANDGHGHSLSHFVTRAHRDLSLVKAVLDTLKVETQLIQRSSHLNFTALDEALESRIKNFRGWSHERRVEDWYVTISASLRLFPAHVWRLWMSDKFPHTTDESVLADYVQSDIRSLDNNFHGEPPLPVPSSLGDKFDGGAAWRRAWGARGVGTGYAPMEPDRGFIKIYVDSSASKTQQLKRCLEGQPDTQPCCLM